MPTVHHIPVCPFSQRLEILLTLKGRRDDVDFRAVDITKPRSPELLALTGGSTALPILVTADGTVLRESLVILRYLDEAIPPTLAALAAPTAPQGPLRVPGGWPAFGAAGRQALPGVRVAQADPMRHAIENLLASHEREFAEAGYRLLMNQDPARRDALRSSLLAQYARLDDVLCRYGRTDAPWLYERFGWAEAIFTPLFMRFWCLGWYEDFELPDEARYARVRAWRDGCLAHPAAQQVMREEVVKLYYDYALGMGNGALAPGRTLSSFVLEPHWSTRPWPPRDKYGVAATDAELGLR